MLVNKEAMPTALVATKVDIKAQRLQRGLSFHSTCDRQATLTADEVTPSAYAMAMYTREPAATSKNVDLCRKHSLVAAPLAP